jgi:hypothetical protein
MPKLSDESVHVLKGKGVLSVEHDRHVASEISSWSQVGSSNYEDRRLTPVPLTIEILIPVWDGAALNCPAVRRQLLPRR